MGCSPRRLPRAWASLTLTRIRQVGSGSVTAAVWMCRWLRVGEGMQFPRLTQPFRSSAEASFWPPTPAPRSPCV